MRAHTITTMIVAGVCALAIPLTASAAPIDSGPYSSVNAITGEPTCHSDAGCSSDYSSVNAIAPPASEPSSQGGSAVDSGYSSLNAITGAPTSEPTFVSTGPGNPGGFDWGSAVVGAGAAMALVALSGAALLTLRRRTAVSPSAASIS